MSLISDLDQKLERVITNAIRHAQFTHRLTEDMDAIESKVAGEIAVAKAEFAIAMETRLAAFEAQFVGGLTAVSSIAADELDRHVVALSGRAGSPEPIEPGRIDPNSGLPTSP